MPRVNVTLTDAELAHVDATRGRLSRSARVAAMVEASAMVHTSRWGNEGKLTPETVTATRRDGTAVGTWPPVAGGRGREEAGGKPCLTAPPRSLASPSSSRG